LPRRVGANYNTAVAKYLFEHGWDQERRRLDLLEQVFDPGTEEYLGRIPLPVGGRCLEVGAGAGSIARWMCDRVGPNGRVVATDLDTGFLEQLTEKNLEVRRHDIVADELEEDVYDLVHSRLVLDHLPARRQVVKRMAAALRPGGWMVQEVFDWSSLVVAAACTRGELHTRMHESLRQVFSAVGASPDFGRNLPLEFLAAGLVDVGAEGRVQVALPGTPASAWWQMSLAALRRPLLGTGHLSEAEVDEALAGCDAAGYCSLYPLLITVWGRRPLG
jgi:2-polyprenyl-3-methyl-5-hydroxy-6-metoxy-1,4-benzoquinol methylase